MPESMELDGKDRNVEASHKSHNPRSRKLRSLVWNDFTKEQRADGTYIAICNHCKKHLTASSRSGTTHLKNHLGVCMSSKRTKRKKLVVRRLALKSAEAKNDGKTGGADCFQFDQELSEQDLARMIVLHGYPFGIIQHSGFKTFLRNLQPQFKLVSFETLKADCLRIYESARLKLQEVLGKLTCRVSLSVDMWKSNVDMEYMCLTCHYIDNDWRFQKKILAFLPVESLSTGEEISKAIVQSMCDCNIDRKVSSLLLDNCSFDDVVANELLNFLQPKGSLHLNGDMLHVHSCAHVLSHIVQDGLELISELINKVRDCMQYVKSSQTRLAKFQDAVKQVGAPKKPIIIDIPSSWTSTYVMLETACEFQSAFTWLASNDDEYLPLSPKDWGDVKAVTECLDVFYQSILKFSTIRIPTANLYFNDICGIHLLLKTSCLSQFPIIISMAKGMLGKFEERWGTTRMVMAIASILDPRYKMKSVEYFFQKIYGDTFDAKDKIENIRKTLVTLYNEYALQSTHASSNQTFLCYAGDNSSCASNECSVGADSKNSTRITLSDARRGLDQYLQEASSSQSMKSDLDMYLDEAVHPSKEGPDESFNILAWWKFNAAKYPVLSMMAHDILGIPVNIPLDNDGRVLNQYLSSTEPATVQALVCAQDWLKVDIEAGNLDGDVCMPLVPVNGDEFSPLSK